MASRFGSCARARPPRALEHGPTHRERQRRDQSRARPAGRHDCRGPPSYPSTPLLPRSIISFCPTAHAPLICICDAPPGYQRRSSRGLLCPRDGQDRGITADARGCCCSCWPSADSTENENENGSKFRWELARAHGGAMVAANTDTDAKKSRCYHRLWLWHT